MIYINSTLAKGEVAKEILLTPYQYLNCIIVPVLLVLIGIVSVIFTGVGLGLCIVLALVMLFYLSFKTLLWRSTTEQAITSIRVVVKTGLLARKTNEIRLSKIEGVSVDQTLLGRILDYGRINVSGTGGRTFIFKWVDNPALVKRNIEEQLGIE